MGSPADERDKEAEVQIIAESHGFGAAQVVAEGVVKLEDKGEMLPSADEIGFAPAATMQQGMDEQRQDDVAVRKEHRYQPYQSLEAGSETEQVEEEEISDFPMDIVCEWKLSLEKIFSSEMIYPHLLPEADDILSLLEDNRLSAHVILTSRIHEILKRMWLDGDCLLGDFADRYFLRARAMKLYKNWAARGLVATRWSVAPSVEAPMVDAEMRGDDMENGDRVPAKVDKGKGRAASMTPDCSDDEDDLVDTRFPHTQARKLAPGHSVMYEKSQDAGTYTSSPTKRKRFASLDGGDDADDEDEDEDHGAPRRRLSASASPGVGVENEIQPPITPSTTARELDAEDSMFVPETDHDGDDPPASRPAASASSWSVATEMTDASVGEMTDADGDVTMIDPAPENDVPSGIENKLDNSKAAEADKQAEPSKVPALEVPRDDEFYHRPFVVQAGNRLFDVGPEVFAGSVLFDGMFALPQPAGPLDGSADRRPLVLPNVGEDQFRAYLRVMTAGMRPNTPPPSAAEWILVLGLADMWDMPTLKADAVSAIDAAFEDSTDKQGKKKQAVRGIGRNGPGKGAAVDGAKKDGEPDDKEKKGMPPLERLELADQYDIPRWKLDVLAEFVWREQPLDAAELVALGTDRLVKFLPAREREVSSRARRDEHMDMGCGCDLCCEPEPALWEHIVEDTMKAFNIQLDDVDKQKVLNKHPWPDSDDEDY